jgi:hypothetical protein
MKHRHSHITLVINSPRFPIGEGGSACAQKIVHDKQKEKQWRSMETGPWDFELRTGTTTSSTRTTPVLRPIGNGPASSRATASVLRSTSPTSRPSCRAVSLPGGAAEAEKIKKAEEERAKVKEMHDEEVVRAADRNVDLVYSTFKDDFARMQGSITEGLTFCLTKSKGKLFPQVR